MYLAYAKFMRWLDRPFEIVIPALTGRSRVVSLPEESDDETIDFSEGLHAFSKASAAISGEWSVRRIMADADSRHAWLRRVTYDVLRFYFDYGLTSVIESRIASGGSYPKGRRKSVNPFQDGLLAIFGIATDGPDANVRRVVGKQLWHAYRHFVPPEFLEGFLLQVGTREIGARSDGNIIEPGFDQWIAECLMYDEVRTGIRPKYPRAIRKMAAPARGWD